MGLKSRFPDKATAITISGEVTNAWVFGLPSALLAKFLLKEWMIEFFLVLSSPSLFHWPIQGPHAFVKILAFKSIKGFKSPSLSAVYLTCSEPGLIPKSAFVTSFLAVRYCPKFTCSSPLSHVYPHSVIAPSLPRVRHCHKFACSPPLSQVYLWSVSVPSLSAFRQFNKFTYSPP